MLNLLKTRSATNDLSTLPTTLNLTATARIEVEAAADGSSLPTYRCWPTAAVPCESPAGSIR